MIFFKIHKRASINDDTLQGLSNATRIDDYMYSCRPRSPSVRAGMSRDRNVVICCRPISRSSLLALVAVKKLLKFSSPTELNLN
jgi:hypothetical protein